jgi:hypothetical protein
MRKLLVLLMLVMPACGGATKKTSNPEPPPGEPTGTWTEAAKDCNEACERVLACKLGPFAAAQDCVTACETADGDEVSLAHWACRGTALSCDEMTECDKAPDDAP